MKETFAEIEIPGESANERLIRRMLMEVEIFLYRQRQEARVKRSQPKRETPR